MRRDDRSPEALKWRQWYGTARWAGKQGVRARQLAKQPLCEMCLKANRITVATVCDHVDPKCKQTEEGFFAGPFQSLCDQKPWYCHSSAKQQQEVRGYSMAMGGDGLPTDPAHPFYTGGRRGLSEEAKERRMPSDLAPSRIPLVIVCGPPGSGKTTYVRANAGPRDLIIDLDDIMGKLSGKGPHRSDRRWLVPALNERNRLLRSLAYSKTYERCWFIIAAPKVAERATWAQRLRAEHIQTMDTPLEECVRRIRADPTRKGREERMIGWARSWWVAQRAATEAIQAGYSTK